MARTYPAKRARIAVEEDTAGETVGGDTFVRTCRVCFKVIVAGQRIVDVEGEWAAHARCADAGEALP
ncbi:hypothetical protein ACFYVR_15885 [Rhodococcus sp. NPDC003318]|uniref:hypothetical protein n=1 Tax=Rhodococcus sp. NPDC003318 TaxID=3364503 RepID=UPI0036BB98E6